MIFESQDVVSFSKNGASLLQTRTTFGGTKWKTIMLVDLMEALK